MKNALQKKYWLHVGMCTTAIYATVYVARPIAEFLRTAIPFTLTINIFFVTILLFFAVHILRRPYIPPKSIVLFSAVAVCCIYFLITIELPEEKIHFLEYGLLAFLVYRAFRLTIQEPQAYVFAFLLTSFLGWIDEGIQHLVPNRFYDIRDIFLNAIGGLLGLCIMYAVSFKKSQPKKTLALDTQKDK